MAQLGRAILLLDLGVCLYGDRRVDLRRADRQRADWVDSGRRAVYALAALSVIAFVLLEIAFLRNDFASRSSPTPPRRRSRSSTS